MLRVVFYVPPCVRGWENERKKGKEAEEEEEKDRRVIAAREEGEGRMK